MEANQNTVCIVIPLYKNLNELCDFERISIVNCFEILGRHQIKFVGPCSLDWLSYERLCKKYACRFEHIALSNEYFFSIAGYNSLLLDINFYKLFSDFKFILIHQTDCYIFKDDLYQWCALNYDYVGAPWFYDVYKWTEIPGLYPRTLRIFHRFNQKAIKKVGNGGLSLRKVSSAINNLKLFTSWVKEWKANEDNFFSHCAGALNPFFRVPPVNIAVNFSFDACPDKAYKLNRQQLPFGCHGWFRTDAPHYSGNLQFWHPFINSHRVINID
ncbi:MAG: DUF5672 family protein [Chitinophagaceae bacterium]